MSRKPLDPSGQKCARCGAELTVARLRRWGPICLLCQPAEAEERKQAALENRAEVITAVQKLIDEEGYPPRSWMRSCTTLAGAIRRLEIQRLFGPGSASSFNLWKLTLPQRPDHFLQLEALCEPGDSVCYFRSPKVTWRNLCGREGLAIMRKGEVAHVLTTSVN